MTDPTQGPPESLGHIQTPTGKLLILDPGLARSWHHDATPDQSDRNPTKDLRIIGPDALIAGQTFDRQFHPQFLYDISDVPKMTELFTRFCREKNLKASLEVLPQQISHIQRAQSALETGKGLGVVQYSGMWAVVVGNLPRDKKLEIQAVPFHTGDFEGRWKYIDLIADESRPTKSTLRVNGVMVEHGQFIFSDLHAFGDFKMWKSLDGLADFVFWGKDAPALAIQTNAPQLNERSFGWLNVPIEKLNQLAQSANEAIEKNTWMVAQDYRPHDNLEKLNSQIRDSDSRVGAITLQGQSVLGFDNRWGDGIFSVTSDLDEQGQTIKVRIETGTEDRQETMRQVFFEAKQAIITKRIANGEPIQFAERLEPRNDRDSGWAFSAGTESNQEMENADNFKLIPLNSVLRQEPSLRKQMQLPPGALLRRQGDIFVEEKN